jgi:hypothetical protein
MAILLSEFWGIVGRLHSGATGFASALSTIPEGRWFYPWALASHKLHWQSQWHPNDESKTVMRQGV